MAFSNCFLILISFSLIILDDKHDILHCGLFAMAGYRAMPSLVRILQSHQAINYIKPILNLVINDLTEQEKLQKSSQIADKGFKDNLIIKDFNFNYDSKIIFKNLNFRIKGICNRYCWRKRSRKNNFCKLTFRFVKTI